MSKAATRRSDAHSTQVDSPNKKLAVAQLGVTQGTILGGLWLVLGLQSQSKLREAETCARPGMGAKKEHKSRREAGQLGASTRGAVQKVKQFTASLETKDILRNYTQPALSLFATHAVKIDAKPGLHSGDEAAVPFPFFFFDKTSLCFSSICTSFPHAPLSV